MLALLGARHILHVSRIRVKNEISQSCLQQSVTSPYHEADKIRSNSSVIVLEDLLFYPLIYSLVLQGVPFLQVSPTKPHMH